MIIKSMSRKEASFRQLIEYMERDNGEVAFGHNLFSNPYGRREDIIREFERNAQKLRERKNGNALYHEVISLERGATLRKEEITRILGEIGREYVARRAPEQLSFGMVHTDSKYAHLHICLSANLAGMSRRERLSKEAFASIQKEMDALVRERWQELNQSRIYGRERGADRLKTTAAEQEIRRRGGGPSRKEEAKARIHGIFERAGTVEELVALLKAEGLEFYQRGKTAGVIDRTTGRKHRLSTLGVEEHYAKTVGRLFDGKGSSKAPEPERPAPVAEAYRTETVGRARQVEPEREVSSGPGAALEGIEPLWPSVGKPTQERAEGARAAESERGRSADGLAKEKPDPRAAERPLDAAAGRDADRRDDQHERRRWELGDLFRRRDRNREPGRER